MIKQPDNDHVPLVLIALAMYDRVLCCHKCLLPMSSLHSCCTSLALLRTKTLCFSRPVNMSPGRHGWTPPTVPPKPKRLPHSPEPSRFEPAKVSIIAHPLEHRPNEHIHPDGTPGQLSNIHASPTIVTSDASGDPSSHIHPYSACPLAPSSITTVQDRGAPRRDSPGDRHSTALPQASTSTVMPPSTGTAVTHGSTAIEDPNGAGLIPLDSPAPSPIAREPSGMQKLFEVIRAKPTLTRTWEKRTYVEELRSAPLRPLTDNGVEERGGRR